MRIILSTATAIAIATGTAAAQSPTAAAVCTSGTGVPAAVDEPPAQGETACSAELQGVDVGSADAPSEAAATSASAIVAATLAEADRRLANMKFVIGPPPRNMTKGRNPAP